MKKPDNFNLFVSMREKEDHDKETILKIIIDEIVAKEYAPGTPNYFSLIKGKPNMKYLIPRFRKELETRKVDFAEEYEDILPKMIEDALEEHRKKTAKKARSATVAKFKNIAKSEQAKARENKLQKGLF